MFFIFIARYNELTGTVCCVSWIVKTNYLELYHGYNLRINLHTQNLTQKNMTWLSLYSVVLVFEQFEMCEIYINLQCLKSW